MYEIMKLQQFDDWRRSQGTSSENDTIDRLKPILAVVQKQIAVSNHEQSLPRRLITGAFRIMDWHHHHDACQRLRSYNGAAPQALTETVPAPVFIRPAKSDSTGHKQWG